VFRVEVTEEGQPPLPSLDLDGNFVIGSGPDARVRLPAAAAEAAHVRIDGNRWSSAEAHGDIGDGHTFTIGRYRVRVAPATKGTKPSPPQRTESLARELMRNLLGTAGAPTLEIVDGPLAGAKRPLAPPESTLVIGRGDEAGWNIADDDLSRAHAEIRRNWDGTQLVDLESKNGTKVDGERVEEIELYDGALIELGKLKLRFRDPADLRPRPAKPPTVNAPVMNAPSRAPFYVALAIMLAALAGLVWVLSA
jgi:predicted component of type VI protein secretion system